MPNWVLENRLFELARTGKRQTHIIVAIVLTIAIVFISQLFAAPLIILQILLFGLPENIETGSFLPTGLSAFEAGIWMTGFLIASYIFVYVLVGLWVWLWEGRAFWTVGFEKEKAFFKYVRGLLIGFLSFSAVTGILAIFGTISFESGNPSLQGLNALSGILIVLIGWAVQGAAEEVLTRGWLMQTLAVRYKPWIGILVSSLIFAILHGLNPNLNSIALINLVLFSFFAALYTLRESSLWGICAFHSIWNWAQGNFFGFPVSGTSAEGGSLIKLVESGNDLITGGAFGPEGGLVVTGVLIISIVILVVWKIKPTELIKLN